jgi:hypothetical protein
MRPKVKPPFWFLRVSISWETEPEKEGKSRPPPSSLHLHPPHPHPTWAATRSDTQSRLGHQHERDGPTFRLNVQEPTKKTQQNSHKGTTKLFLSKFPPNYYLRKENGNDTRWLWIFVIATWWNIKSVSCSFVSAAVCVCVCVFFKI